MSEDIQPKKDHAPKRIGVRGCLIGCGGIIAMCVLVVVVGVFAWIRRDEARVSRMLADIRARGEPTSPAELQEFYVLADGAEDTTSLWVEAIGAFESSGFREDAESLPIVGDGDEIPLPGQPWPQLEQVDAFLKKYDKEMRLMHEAAAKGGAARYETKFEDGIMMLLPHAHQLRGGARMLALEANVRAHRGDAKGVADSIETMHRLGESLKNEPVMISQLVRIAIAGINADLIRKTVPQVEYSDEDLERLSKMLKDADFHRGLRTSMLGERVLGIVAIRDPDSLGEELPSRFPKFVQSAWLVHYLEAIDQPIAAMQKSFPQVLDDLEQFEKDVENSVSGAGGLRGIMTALLAPAFEAAATATARAEMTNDALQTAIAIEQYRRKNGKLPETLAALVPEFLEKVPVDPFDGHPLRYVPSKNGAKLYSVGQDRKDDGGTGETEPDIVHELTWLASGDD